MPLLMTRLAVGVWLAVAYPLPFGVFVVVDEALLKLRA